MGWFSKIGILWIFLVNFVTYSFAYTSENIESANFLAEKWIIENRSTFPSQYNLDMHISRKEMLKIMVQISWKETPSTCSKVYFLDIPTSDWACKYAEVAVKNSFITQSAFFRPNDSISQIESLKMIMQAQGIERNQNSDWRAGYVLKAYSLKLINSSYLSYDIQAFRSWIFDIAMKSYSEEISQNTDYKTFAVWISSSTLQVGKDIRYYKAYAPKQDMIGRPLVMFLHGGMGSMDIIENETTGKILQDIATRENILIVIPNASDPATWAFDGTKNNWNDYRNAEQNSFFQSSRDTQYTENIDDVLFLNTLIEKFQEDYGLSQKNVFVFGHSNGGLMTQRLLVDDGSYVAAAAFLSANVPKLQETKVPKYAVPVLLWLGVEDPLMKYPVQSDPAFPFLSGEASALWWAQKNATNSTWNTETLTPTDTEGCSTKRIIYTGTKPVYFYTSQGAWHTISSIKYPSEMGIFQKNIVGEQCHDIEEIEEVWKFFKSYIQ